mmetsp:Transcript_48313/g.35494  ORF Transcript_48313/g.35494 Transcript_48313/m.35494 type:complete len:91 (+) Transcript_48313:984-1256(+)
MQRKNKEEISNVNFDDPLFTSHFSDPHSPNFKNIEHLLMSLAVCHTVISEHKEGRLVYNASSPDELALVNLARFLGATFVDRDADNNVVV